MIFEEDNSKGVVEAPKNNVTTLWVEKYRPRTLADVIIPQRVRTQIQFFLDKGLTRHLLMYGSAGTGKTTIARILTSGKQTLSINASEENGIETVRDRIIPFSNVSSMNGGTKIIFLDEIDNLSKAAALAFRGVIESGANTVRYIGTCNYPERLDEPIRSRFGVKINFDFKGAERKEVLTQKVQRIFHICKQEGITIDNKAILLMLSKMSDMRDIIESLQSMFEMGIKDITVEHIEQNIEQKYDAFYEMVTTKGLNILDARAFILENYPNLYFELIVAMGDKMAMWVKEKNKTELMKILPFIYVLSNRYKNDSMNKPDLLTSVLALIVEIQHYIK